MRKKVVLHTKYLVVLNSSERVPYLVCTYFVCTYLDVRGVHLELQQFRSLLVCRCRGAEYRVQQQYHLFLFFNCQTQLEQSHCAQAAVGRCGLSCQTLWRQKKKKHADNNLWNSLATEERLFYSPKSNGMEEGQLLLEPHHQGFGIRRLFSKVCEASGVRYRPQSDPQKQYTAGEYLSEKVVFFCFHST